VTVNLTRIYTRLGDDGKTHLGDMSRVPKTDPRVEAYGTVDELNSALGVAKVQPELPKQLQEYLERIQNDLFDVGADLCVPADSDRKQNPLRVGPEYTKWLEETCDLVNGKLKPLRSFVIPGSNPASAHLHLARTICRRAERRALAVEGVNQEVIRYLNRLSDLLFILARAAAEGEPELWQPGAHRGA
jgi:cob(I)alamin adenosyltransferase